MKCCIAITVKGHPLTDDERLALVQAKRVLKAREFVLFAPDGCPWAAEYEGILEPVRRIVCPVSATVGWIGEAAHRVNTDYYDLLAAYDFVFTLSADTWVFYDALDWWMARGEDYVAAPYVSLSGDGSVWFRGQLVRRGGCAEASLRRIRPIREYVRQICASKFDYQLNGLSESAVLSGILPEPELRRLPKVAYHAWADQARFVWVGIRLPAEPETSDHPCDSGTLLALTRGHLPMAVVRPSPAFRETYCIPDMDYTSVFLFANAVTPQHDYYSLVNGIEGNPEKRLLVFMNLCRGFRENETGLRLVRQQKRLVTFHNLCSGAPFGYAGIGEAPLFLRNAGWAGRHDFFAFYRAASPRGDFSGVSYDGEITADAEQTSVRSIGGNVNSGTVGTPTAGFMAYRIMRDRYPKAVIYLVNFYGNTNGFTVLKPHNPEYEQSVFRQDPLVRFVFAKDL